MSKRIAPPVLFLAALLFAAGLVMGQVTTTYTNPRLQTEPGNYDLIPAGTCGNGFQLTDMTCAGTGLNIAKWNPNGNPVDILVQSSLPLALGTRSGWDRAQGVFWDGKSRYFLDDTSVIGPLTSATIYASFSIFVTASSSSGDSAYVGFVGHSSQQPGDTTLGFGVEHIGGANPIQAFIDRPGLPRIHSAVVGAGPHAFVLCRLKVNDVGNVESMDVWLNPQPDQGAAALGMTSPAISFLGDTHVDFHQVEFAVGHLVRVDRLRVAYERNATLSAVDEDTLLRGVANGSFSVRPGNSYYTTLDAQISGLHPSPAGEIATVPMTPATLSFAQSSGTVGPWVVAIGYELGVPLLIPGTTSRSIYLDPGGPLSYVSFNLPSLTLIVPDSALLTGLVMQGFSYESEQGGLVFRATDAIKFL